MSGIFISYRRDDSSGWAGRLHEHLVDQWGSEGVFMDIDAIAPGEDFREAIARTMETCEVVIVVIGPRWASARDEAGGRRLDDESDIHRAEVAAALTADVRVIPVLVGGADMPRGSDLPAPLRDLAYRNAAVLEDRSFVRDVRSLQSSLRPSTEVRDTGSESDRLRPQGVDASELNSRTWRSMAPDLGNTRSRRSSAATVLTLVGAALVLVWGALVPRNWHAELSGVRIGAAVLCGALAAIGTWRRQWSLVLVGGAAGLAALALWALQLLVTGHSFDDLFSQRTDGLPNGVAFLGAFVIVLASEVGRRSDGTPQAPGGRGPRA